jgi:hypothetical protein
MWDKNPGMTKDQKIMDIALPIPEAAELATRAASAGVPTAEYLGILALSTAYGLFHPWVAAFRSRAKEAQCGTETPDGEA